MEVFMKRILFLCLSLILISSSLFSTQVIYKNNVVEDKNFTDPYIFFGDNLDFKGKSDDLFAFGKNINFSGESAHSFFSMGENITSSAKIGHNLMLVGGKIYVSNEVNGTTFIAGGTAYIQKDAVFNGTVFLGAGEINVLGKINGDLFAGSGRVLIDGIVNGNVKVCSGKLSIGENGKINGNIEYYSEWEMSKLEKSKITGTAKFTKLSEMKNGRNSDEANNLYKMQKMFNKDNFKNAMAGIRIFFLIITLISFLVGGLLILLFPSMSKLEEERTKKNFWMYSLWGLIPFFIYVGALLFSLILFPIFFVLLLAIIPVMFITQILGATLLGQFFFNVFKIQKTNRFLYFLMGFAFFVIISFIPGLNVISGLLFICAGLGLILEILFRKKIFSQN
jgi:hypothetical protein